MPFPLFTDAHVQQPLVDALVRRGWDVVRAIDTFPEGTGDDVLFEYAVREGRFFVTNDGPAEAIGIRWLRQGRPFPGMICWPQRYYDIMSTGDFLRELDALAAAVPFAYPIQHIKPKR